MHDSLIIIILILSLSGVFGGLTNFFMSDVADKKMFNLLRSIFIGLCASFMVPLFLNMISSNLLEQIRGVGSNPGDPLRYFILAGFCLVAAISSRAFIQTLSERVFRELRETEEKQSHTEKVVSDLKDDIAPIIAKETEIDQSDEVKAQKATSLSELSEDQQKVLKAMVEGKHFFRSITGITRDTGLQREYVHNAVNELMSKGLIGQREDKKGTWWFVTVEGRGLYDT